METASVREASARVIAALSAAGRSRTTIKRHEAELNAFARFLQDRGQDLPTEADCVDFVAQRSGCRLAGLREPASSRQAQLARRPLVLLMECLHGGMPRVGQATAPLVDRCPARFRPARDEYLTACRRRNAEASVVTKQRAADAFLACLEEAGRESLGQAQARDLAGFWARRQNRGRHLVKQRLKNVVIGAVNQNDFRGTPAESLGSRQAAKAPTDNNNTWHIFIHSFFSFQFVQLLIV